MKAPVVEWGAAGQPLPGQTESGDRSVVQLADGRATVAVIDGLGHGSEAALASRAAVDVLESHPDEEIVHLFRRCHARLRTTRGAAMTVAQYDVRSRRISWLGAGNVRAVLLRTTPEGAVEYQDLLVYSGAVGVQLPTIEVSNIAAQPGDLLFLATDGIHDGFADSLRHGENPQVQADRLLAEHRVRTDDALILVARILR